MIKDYLTEINLRITRLEDSVEFSCRELLSDLWPAISQQYRPQIFGMAFSRAVENGQISGVVFSRIERSPHMTIWRKVPKQKP